MTTEERKEAIRSKIQWDNSRQNVGGQHCGLIYPAAILISEDLDFRIEIGYHRSRHKNRQLAMVLFEMTLDELIV